MNIFTRIARYLDIRKKVSLLNKEIDRKEDLLKMSGRKSLKDYHDSRISLLKMQRDLLREERKRLFNENRKPVKMRVSVTMKDDSQVLEKKARKPRSDKGKKRGSIKKQ